MSEGIKMRIMLEGSVPGEVVGYNYTIPAIQWHEIAPPPTPPEESVSSAPMWDFRLLPGSDMYDAQARQELRKRVIDMVASNIAHAITDFCLRKNQQKG
jgi:hypothetical protein